MKKLVIILVLFVLASPAFAQRFGPGQEKVAINNWPGTQPVSFTTPVAVSGTFWQATQPVQFDRPVATTGTFWPDTQPVSFTTPISVTGTFYQTTQAVEVDDEIPVRVQQTGTANVRVISTAVPTVHRYPEFILPTEVDGVSKTVALTHTPVKWTLENLHDTAPVYFSKGGAAATVADFKLNPGQSITGEDEEKLFSVYSTDETTPPTFEIFAVYEVSL